MSKPLHVRLSAEAYDCLRLLASAHGKTLGGLAGEILTRRLLGAAQVEVVAAQQKSTSANTRKS